MNALIKSICRPLSLLALPGALGAATQRELRIEIELPELEVAEYHRPYVAVWIENERREWVDNVAVWYDTELRNREGETWLKDLRQWWRKSGRDLSLPVDGVTGPTRPPGRHELRFDSESASFLNLNPGTYQLVVEVAREVGGRELLRLPLPLHATESVKISESGSHEIATVTLALN